VETSAGEPGSTRSVGNPKHVSEFGAGSSSGAAGVRPAGKLNLGSFGAGGMLEAAAAGRLEA